MPPSPPAQVLEHQDTKGKRPSSPLAKDKDLQDTTGNMPPPPLSKTFVCILLQKQPIYEAAEDSSSSGIFVSGQKVQNIDKNACRQMFQALEPFRKEVVVDEPRKDMVTTVSKIFSCHKKYQHQEPLRDLGIPGTTVKEIWEDSDKDRNEFEYEKPLVTKQVHANFMWPMRRLHEWYYHVYVCDLQFIEGHIYEEVLKS
jgi:hypothetical protein